MIYSIAVSLHRKSCALWNPYAKRMDFIRHLAYEIHRNLTTHEKHAPSAYEKHMLIIWNSYALDILHMEFICFAYEFHTRLNHMLCICFYYCKKIPLKIQKRMKIIGKGIWNPYDFCVKSIHQKLVNDFPFLKAHS